MFKFFKNFFAPTPTLTFKEINVNTNKAFIEPLNDGGANLLDFRGSVIATYSRVRDARRGATRRGLALA